MEINFKAINPCKIHISTDSTGLMTAWVWDDDKQLVVGRKQFSNKIVANKWYKFHAKNLVAWLQSGLVEKASF